MVGVFWGSPLFGWTSDTYGRKPTIVACLSLCLASMALIRFARDGLMLLFSNYQKIHYFKNDRILLIEFIKPVLSHSWILLLALRMFDGAGAIGAIAAAFVLISEVFESVGYHKIMVLQVAQACFGLSQVGLAYLGIFENHALFLYIFVAIILYNEVKTFVR